MGPDHVYALLFFLMVIEGAGIPAVPFEPVFLLAGYFIEQGTINFWLAVAVGTLGNFVGNLLGYWLGARPGRKFLEDLLRRWSKRQENMDLMKKWFERYGAAVVIIARWFGPIRTPTILGAGILGMPAATYAFYSLVGSFSWTLAWQYGCWKGTGALIYWWQNYGGEGLFILALLATGFAGIYGYVRFRSATSKHG
ncbi:MAG: hypothetical protein PWP65_1229 [Clostridia bacterium]|nr:hypothetical protein [Clostridia bacterium]